MGEAKRKASKRADKRGFMDFMDSIKIHSLSHESDEPCAHTLLVEIEYARTHIGEFPDLVRGAVADAIKVKDSDPKSHAIALIWTLWPSERIEVHMVRQDEDLKRQLLTRLITEAGARGYGTRFCAFPGNGWNEEFIQIHDAYEKHVAEIRQLAAEQPDLEIINIDGESIIRVPFIEDAATCAGITALLLRKFDELVATEESIRRSIGSVSLSFDGLDSDPREVWEFEHCEQLLLRLTEHAPYWPLLIRADLFLMFLGALMSNGKTVINTLNEVSFPVDADLVDVLREYWIKSSMEVVHAAGMDFNGEESRNRFVEIAIVLGQLTKMLNERTEALARGEAEVASPEAILRSQQSQLNTARAYIFDRSPLGLDLVEQLLHGDQPLSSVSARASLQEWLGSTTPIAVLSNVSPDYETSWHVSSHADDSQALLNLVRELATKTIGERTSFAWVLGVEDALKTQLTELGKSVFLEVATELGGLVVKPEESNSKSANQWHEGLLKLATEPIGREVDFGMVQITDAKEFSKVMNLGLDNLMSAMQEIRKGTRKLGNPTDLERLYDGQVRAWEREDGSLLVRETSQQPNEVVVEAGKWRLLSKEQRAVAEQQVRENWSSPDLPAALSEIADDLNQTLQLRTKQMDAVEKLFENATCVVSIFGRESQSLLSLKSILGTNASAIDVADRWLNGHDAYFVFCRAKSGEACVFLAIDEGELMENVLPSALEQGEEPEKTILFAATTTAVDQRAEQWWGAQGGLVRPVIRKGH